MEGNYRVSVRGALPDDLSHRISKCHAVALIARRDLLADSVPLSTRSFSDKSMSAEEQSINVTPGTIQ